MEAEFPRSGIFPPSGMHRGVETKIFERCFPKNLNVFLISLIGRSYEQTSKTVLLN